MYVSDEMTTDRGECKINNRHAASTPNKLGQGQEEKAIQGTQTLVYHKVKLKLKFVKKPQKSTIYIIMYEILPILPTCLFSFFLRHVHADKSL
jgi:hypothetical protein